MTATTRATGRETHVDTAAVSGQAAWGAGLGFGWVPQIIQLRGGDREEMKQWMLGDQRTLFYMEQHSFVFKENHFLL